MPKQKKHRAGEGRDVPAGTQDGRPLACTGESADAGAAGEIAVDNPTSRPIGSIAPARCAAVWLGAVQRQRLPAARRAPMNTTAVGIATAKRKMPASTQASGSPLAKA